jgi:pimeloyl-ACP methyl ester carboxylesterase
MFPKLFGTQARVHQPELLEEFFAMMSRQTPETVIAALTALRDRPDALPGLKQLEVPTLVIVGDEDAITPPSQAKIIAETVRGAELAVLPGAGHMSNRESAAFNGVLRDFLP